MENSRNWYAVLRDNEDGDCDTGSFDWDEAVEMAKNMGYERIAEINGNYDENGDPTTDTLCVAMYIAGEDF
jgi:hypothetical protein